jgi:hypothetical protein
MTGDERYLAEAKRAFGAFMVNYDDGGVASDEGRDSLFLQLLAKPGFQKTYVLNGHTNSLLFIWKYYEYTLDYRALIVFGKGVNWLVSNLQKMTPANGPTTTKRATERETTTTRGTSTSLENCMNNRRYRTERVSPQVHRIRTLSKAYNNFCCHINNIGACHKERQPPGQEGKRSRVSH